MIIDLHNHILPGVDDGALSMEDAVVMAIQAEKCGIKKIVATPHYCRGCGASLAEIEEAYRELSSVLKNEQINVKLEKGMEIMATDELPELLKKGEVWTYPDSSYFLVEFDLDEDEAYFDGLLDRCKNNGFVPIIAHPERYRAVRHRPKLVETWHKKGYGIQVNRDSLLGHFGEASFTCADLFMKNGWVNCIASDAHSPQTRNSRWSDAFCRLPSRYGLRILAYCLETAPEKILSNLPL